MAYHMEMAPHNQRKVPRFKPLTADELVKHIEQKDTLNPFKLIKEAKVKSTKIKSTKK